MKQKVVTMGQTKWRDGDVSAKGWSLLNHQQKDEHIRFLLTLEDNELSTRDEYILRFYGPKKAKKNFISILDDIKPEQTIREILVEDITPTDVLPVIPDELLKEQQKLIDNIPTYSKEKILNYLDHLFVSYPKWKLDFYNCKLESFIQIVRKEYSDITELDIAMINEFKKRKI